MDFMKLNRRQALLGTLAAGFAALFGFEESLAGPKKRRKRRRKRIRRRRRIRRRHRRRVRHRMFGTHRRWVVPVALAIGWELMLDDKVVVVQETKYIMVESQKVEVVVVVHTDGTTEEVQVHREDDEENSKALEGTELAEDDTTTPAIETEIEEEVEVEVDDDDAPEAG
jgi:hypothetical protein